MSAAAITHEPTGKAAGKTTQAATAGSFGGGALGVLVSYLLIKTGFETDAETAVLVGGTIATLIGGVIAYFRGRATPTDQVRTVTEFVGGTETVDPSVEAEREAAAYGVPDDYQPKHAA